MCNLIIAAGEVTLIAPDTMAKAVRGKGASTTQALTDFLDLSLPRSTKMHLKKPAHAERLPSSILVSTCWLSALAHDVANTLFQCLAIWVQGLGLMAEPLIT